MALYYHEEEKEAELTEIFEHVFGRCDCTAEEPDENCPEHGDFQHA